MTGAGGQFSVSREEEDKGGDARSLCPRKKPFNGPQKGRSLKGSRQERRASLMKIGARR